MTHMLSCVKIWSTMGVGTWNFKAVQGSALNIAILRKWLNYLAFSVGDIYAKSTCVGRVVCRKKVEGYRIVPRLFLELRLSHINTIPS